MNRASIALTAAVIACSVVIPSQLAAAGPPSSPGVDARIGKAQWLSAPTADRSFGFDPSVSADGRYVTFTSYSSALEAEHLFVHDRVTGADELVDQSSSGEAANTADTYGQISQDGRYVAFSSYADNLVEGDDNGDGDVFLRDLRDGTTTLVSAALDGTSGSRWSGWSVVSADGHFVVFESTAKDLVKHAPSTPRNFYVRDMTSGVTTLLTAGLDGHGSNGSGIVDDVSGDGRYVVLSSTSTDLTPGEKDKKPDIFWIDRTTDKVIKVSQAMDGGRSDGHSSDASISNDGTTVVFESLADNLVDDDINRVSDVFAWDAETKVITMLSRTRKPLVKSGHSHAPSISPDGRYVAYTAERPRQQVAGLPANCNDNVILRDLDTGTSSVVALFDDGTCGDRPSRNASISGNGYVAYETDTGFDPDDGNLFTDVYETRVF